MSNIEKAAPGVKIVLNGEERTLKLTLGAFAKLEQVTGKNALSNEAWANPNATMIVALVWAALNDDKLTLDEVGSWISLGQIAEVSEAIQKAMEQALPDEKKPDSPKNEISLQPEQTG